ncbi:MAG TPA: hypothetical protein VN081_03315 [Dongiaceae bacterium]|nr:hypothetical protein [Dongiaceae bacterium]
MRVVVLYKEQTDYARQVEEFTTDFLRQTGHELETLNPESSEGIRFCEAYDIMEFPTLMAISNDGQVQNQWTGVPLPTISEVSYYV